MRSSKTFLLVTLTGWLGLAVPCVAAAIDTGGTLYALTVPPSSLIVGCLPPCTCADVTVDTFGSFVLVATGFDPLYTHYAIERFIASFNNGPGAVAITGSGEYRVGGEVALLQQLTLDLDIQGRPTQHFDSGLVPVTSNFPHLSIRCAVHGFACDDSVIALDAQPVGTEGAPLSAGRATTLEAVRPNPFTARARIGFTLDRAGPVELLILDLAGRRVRTLLKAVASGPEQRGVTWEGRDDSGRLAPAGVYWAVLRTTGAVNRQRFVKLE